MDDFFSLNFPTIVHLLSEVAANRAVCLKEGSRLKKGQESKELPGAADH